MNRLLLLKAVEFAARAITGKTSLPVLECLHLKGDGERLQVTGYNLDLYARMWAESDLVIDCCAPAGRLKTLLTNFTGEDVDIDEIEDSIIVRCGGRGTVATLPAKDFPPIPKVDGKRFPIPCEAIAKVASAASTEAARYVMQSVYLDKAGVAVAADGRRGHWMKIDGPGESIVVPVGAAKLLAEMSGEMRTKAGLFIATGEDCEIGGKLVDGAYPKVPQPPDRTGIAVTDEFVAVIKRAQACMGTVLVPYVDIHPGIITTKDFDEPFEIDIPKPFRANPGFLLDAIKAAGDGATLCAPDGNGPVIIRNGDFRAAVMPMEIK